MSQRFQVLESSVVVYFEEVEGELFGLLSNLQTGKKINVNGDASRLLQAVMEGQCLEDIVPQNIGQNLRTKVIAQSALFLDGLEGEGMILRSDVSVKSFPPKIVSAKPPLRAIFLEVSKACNLRCRHCYVTDIDSPRTSEEMSAKDIIRVVEQADALGVMEVELTGGEFFLKPGAVDILKFIGNKRIPCSVFTNATIFPDALAQLLSKGAWGITFYISLDGPEQVHDWFRRREGAYEKTISTLRKMKEMDYDFRITTIVGKHNIDHIPSLVAFVDKEFGVQHRFDVIQSVGRGKECQDLVISSEEFSSLMKGIQKEVKFLDDRDRSEDRDWSVPACGAGSEMFFVDAYGNAGICPTLTRDQDISFFAGNVLTGSVQDIWENSRTFSLFRGIQCEKIAGCPAREKCSGGCRSRAFLSSTDLRAPDVLLCDLFK